ncbi:9125_t:CDS:2 [Dentiscutata erythropus]|uniref:9125_t:CDS:1 n=1 Tax=Dentiscutata erythropus TaxID=1348616 RepID=A0A9N9P7J6_9GLOM|nr:9125_t:CDS:2 [Dentiscutata erythropus]
MSIQKDIVTPFSKHSQIKQKAFHEHFIILNSISFRDIDFEHSYIILYKKRNPKEQFDLLKHNEHIKFFDFFKCKCGNNKTNFRNEKEYKFREDLWQYDNRYTNWECPFRRRCRYFKLLQSVDKNIPKKDRLGSLSDKDSLMKFKKLLPIENIVNTRLKKLKQEEYKLQSPQWQPQSPSI